MSEKPPADSQPVIQAQRSDGQIRGSLGTKRKEPVDPLEGSSWYDRLLVGLIAGGSAGQAGGAPDLPAISRFLYKRHSHVTSLGSAASISGSEEKSSVAGTSSPSELRSVPLSLENTEGDSVMGTIRDVKTQPSHKQLETDC
jgi:hypothetical protein